MRVRLAVLSRVMRRQLLAACVTASIAGAAPLVAQQPGAAPPSPNPTPAESTVTNADVPWRTSYFPYITSLANDGPIFAARLRHFKQAAYEDRVAAREVLQLDAGIGWHGSRFAAAQFRAPRLAPGWRLYALAIAVREARFGFYGLGNNTVRDPALEANGHDLFYRVSRRGYRGQVDVTRHIAGPFHVAVMGELLASRYSALAEQTTLFQQVIGPELKEDDASVRGALVFDTRDVEYDTHRGLLLEAGGQVGSGGAGYQRLYSVLRGWVNPRDGTVLAARLLGSQLYGTPSLDARYLVPAWERPILVLGGQYSLRGLDLPRFVGKGVLLGNFELRQDVKSFAGVATVGFIGFLDAGRVFEATEFKPTFDDLKVGGGGGLVLKLLRSTIFTFTLARGPERTIFYVTNGWLF